MAACSVSAMKSTPPVCLAGCIAAVPPPSRISSTTASAGRGFGFRQQRAFRQPQLGNVVDGGGRRDANLNISGGRAVTTSQVLSSGRFVDCPSNVPMLSTRLSCRQTTNCSGRTVNQNILRPALGLRSMPSLKSPSLRESYLSTSSPCKGSRRQITVATVGAAAAALAGNSLLSPSSLFTIGTAFVMPYYTAMILAPHAAFTKKLVKSPFASVVMALMYIYLLAVSWQPDTLQLMFANKYYMPELHGIVFMFSRVATVASAWIHLLVMDLFAARHIYLEGLREGIEARHSLVLCMLFGPLGLISHFATRAFVLTSRSVSPQATPVESTAT